MCFRHATRSGFVKQHRKSLTAQVVSLCNVLFKCWNTRLHRRGNCVDLFYVLQTLYSDFHSRFLFPWVILTQCSLDQISVWLNFYLTKCLGVENRSFWKVASLFLSLLILCLCFLLSSAGYQPVKGTRIQSCATITAHCFRPSVSVIIMSPTNAWKSDIKESDHYLHNICVIRYPPPDSKFSTFFWNKREKLSCLFRVFSNKDSLEYNVFEILLFTVLHLQPVLNCPDHVAVSGRRSLFRAEIRIPNRQQWLNK